MTKLFTFLKNKKTYLVAGSMAVYAIIGWFLDFQTTAQAADILFVAAGMAGLRDAINNAKLALKK